MTTTLRGVGSDNQLRLLCEALALSRQSSAAFVAEFSDAGWTVMGVYRDAAHRDLTLHVPVHLEIDRDIEIRIITCFQTGAADGEGYGHFAPILHNGDLIGVIGVIDVVREHPAIPSERLAMFRFAELAGRRLIERSVFRLHARQAFALLDGDLEEIRAASAGHL